MSRLVFLTVAVLTAGRSPQPAATQVLPPIERFQVGQVVIGKPAEDVYEAFPAERRRLVDLGLEGQLSPALEFTFPGTTRTNGVVAELECQRGLMVSRIFVRDPAFRTAKGVGVGSSVGELRAAYRLDSVVSGEGTVGIRVEELSATFEIDQTGPGGDRFWRLRTAETIPASVKIIAVLLTKVGAG